MDAASSWDQAHRGVPNRKFENLAKALTGLGAVKRAVLPGEYNMPSVENCDTGPFLYVCLPSAERVISGD
jgi:hypothetical protein